MQGGAGWGAYKNKISRTRIKAHVEHNSVHGQEYAIWVQSLAQPSAAMKEFSEYIAEQQQIREDDQNRKRPRDEGNDGKCIVCLDRALTAAFIPCGHCVTVVGQKLGRDIGRARRQYIIHVCLCFPPVTRCCYECASSMENSRCPICRKVAAVQRLFVG